jgi:E3 ubiquitin-protein ligase HERC1
VLNAPIGRSEGLRIYTDHNIFQEQAFNELIKNSDKESGVGVSGENGPPIHLHELLASLQKHLLAYCHVNAQQTNLVSSQCTAFLVINFPIPEVTVL